MTGKQSPSTAPDSDSISGVPAEPRAQFPVGTDPWWVLVQIDHAGGCCRHLDLRERLRWRQHRLTDALQDLRAADFIETRTHEGKTLHWFTHDGEAFANDWPIRCIDETWRETHVPDRQ